MKYTAIIAGKERELEVVRRDEHRFQVFIEGESHEVDARNCSADWLSILLDHCSYDISYTLDKDTLELNFRNQYFDIEILDERKLRMRRVRSALAHSGPEIIKTSMPGKVVKLLVEPGDQVAEGEGIIIIEAMKMENEIQCRNPGIIKTVHVEAGQTVEGGIPLVEIDPLPSTG